MPPMPDVPKENPVNNSNDSDLIKGSHPVTIGGVTAQSQLALDLPSYVYNAGFVHGVWADTFLTVSQHPTLHLHALLVSRSPLLYRYLSALTSQGHGPPYRIDINVDDINLTPSALSAAIAMLYGHTFDIHSCKLDMAKGLIAAGSFLGVGQIAGVGYNVICNLLSSTTVIDILSFSMRPQVPSLLDATPANIPNPEDLTEDYSGPYPSITSTLLRTVIDFILNNFQASFPLDSTFENALLMLPFPIFKMICESDQLLVGTRMDRHNFAREVINLRARNRKASGGPQYEETVVLAFGGAKHGIEVVRKQLGRKKTLWKAGQ